MFIKTASLFYLKKSRTENDLQKDHWGIFCYNFFWHKIDAIDLISHYQIINKSNPKKFADLIIFSLASEWQFK